MYVGKSPTLFENESRDVKTSITLHFPSVSSEAFVLRSVKSSGCINAIDL